MHQSAKLLASVSAAALALAPTAMAQQPQCAPNPDAAVFELALDKVPGPDLKGTPFTTTITIAGKSRSVLIDTGSPAVNVPYAMLPPGATTLVKDAYYGYISSGNYYQGDWVLTQVTLSVKDPRTQQPTSLQTPVMPVFGAKATCKGDPSSTTNPPVCTPLPTPTGGEPAVGPGMMGVAYKITPVGPGKRTDTNVFLNLPQLTNPGYVITSRSIWLGLTQSAQRSFGMVPLQGPDINQQSPHACISYATQGQGNGPFCGTLLMDTGINHLYLTMPKGYCPAGLGQQPVPVTVTAGQALTWRYTSQPVPATVGPGGSSGDNCVSPADDTVAYHTNTGRMLLADYDYLYDASCRAVGFRPKAPQ